MEYFDVFKTLERQIFHIFRIFQINSTAIPPHEEEIYPKGNKGSSIFNAGVKMQIEVFQLSKASISMFAITVYPKAQTNATHHFQGRFQDTPPHFALKIARSFSEKREKTTCIHENDLL